MEVIPRNFLHCSKEKYIIRSKFNPADCASGLVVWYTYPNNKRVSVQVESWKPDEIIVSESPTFDGPCSVNVDVLGRVNGKRVTYFSLQLLSLVEYLFQKVFFPYKSITPEVVDPQIVTNMLAMFMAYYCNVGSKICKEGQTDGILQTLVSQLKDYKGNLASITTASYGTQENIIHFVLRNKLVKTAHYLIRNMKGYDHLFLEHDKDHRTPSDLAARAGYHDLKADMVQKASVKKPLSRTHSSGGNSNTYYVVGDLQYENPKLSKTIAPGNKPFRKGIVKERYKHLGLMEILEVGDVIDVISGPDGGVYEVSIKNNHCFVPQVILQLEDSSDQSDADHTYDEIQDIQSGYSKVTSEDLYVTVKSAEKLQKPQVSNQYVVAPVNPSTLAISLDDDRTPQAPPRSKDSKKLKNRSATLPTPHSKSRQAHAPSRPPLPNVHLRSSQATVSTPPRWSKSTSEPVYDNPITKRSASASCDQSPEYEECYVEPAVTAESSNQSETYLEVYTTNSVNSSNTKQKDKENIFTNSKGDANSIDSKIKGRQTNSTDTKGSCDSADDSKQSDKSKSSAATDSIAGDRDANSTDTEKSKRVADSSHSNGNDKIADKENDKDVNPIDNKSDKSSSDVKTGEKDAALSKLPAADATTKDTATENVLTPCQPLANQSNVSAASTDDTGQTQNLTISQARKMFEATTHASQGSGKTTSPTSKVIKNKNVSSVAEHFDQTKATERKQETNSDGSPSAESIGQDLPNDQSNGTQQGVTAVKSEEASLAVNKTQISKSSIPIKPNKPATAKKPVFK